MGVTNVKMTKKLTMILAVIAGLSLGVHPVWEWGTQPVFAEVDDDHDKHEEEDHDDHDEEGDAHEEHDDHDEDVVRLDSEAMRDFGVEVREAASGHLAVYTRLPGEVVIDPDRLVHVVPRVPGVALQVHKSLGDRVRVGEVLAVLESRELAELKSAYLVARERVQLAQKTFAREEKLWKETISSERDYLEAEQNLAEHRIELRAAEQKLHALGFSHAYLDALTFEEDQHFTRYEIHALQEGIIIEKHLSLGEVLKGDVEAFVIADLSSVWAKLTVYQKDLASVRQGQAVQIVTDGATAVEGRISYVSPIVDEKTRTTVARVVLDNQDNQWRPGAFVSGLVAVEASAVSLLVPKSALQMVEGQTVVFVETEEGFEPRAVHVGRSNEVDAEIVDGLERGQRYVARGAFTLKAQLAKGSFGDGHSH